MGKISKKEFKKSGWSSEPKDPKYPDIIEHYSLKRNIELKYWPGGNSATILVERADGMKVEVGTLEDFDYQKLLDATEVLELNYIELVTQLFKED